MLIFLREREIIFEDLLRIIYSLCWVPLNKVPTVPLSLFFSILHIFEYPYSPRTSNRFQHLTRFIVTQLINPIAWRNMESPIILIAWRLLHILFYILFLVLLHQLISSFPSVYFLLKILHNFLGISFVSDSQSVHSFLNGFVGEGFCFHIEINDERIL